MGQHTWCYKSKQIQKEMDEIYDEYEKTSDSSILEKYDELFDSNESEFHDIFRTWKKQEDDTYLEIQLNSREETLRWIDENMEFIDYLNIDKVNEFWDKYPDGFIEFG